MRLSEITGNEEVRKAFAGMVMSGKVPHAICLHEDDGSGAVVLALAFLQALYCRNGEEGDSCGRCPSCNKISKLIHPDIHFVFPVTSGNLSVAYSAQWRKLVTENPLFTEADFTEAMGFEGKLPIIAVSEAKSVLDTLSLSALEGGYRSVLVYLPERMNQEAANRLLKMIEEPPLKTQFVLITHAPEKVLTTISSRCQQIRVLPSGKRTGGEEEFAEFDELMNALIAKDLLKALEIGDALAALPSRESAKRFCRYASERLREIFLVQQKLLDKDVPACSRQFPRRAMEMLNRAMGLIDRNVNLKILFSDLVNRLIGII